MRIMEFHVSIDLDDRPAFTRQMLRLSREHHK